MKDLGALPRDFPTADAATAQRDKSASPLIPNTPTPDDIEALAEQAVGMEPDR